MECAGTVSGALPPASSLTAPGGTDSVPNEPSLLEELGLDEETLTWRHLALCKGMAPESNDEVDMFFEGYESDPELAKAMDEICLSCPVMKDCLMRGTDDKDYGLRGAIYLANGKPDMAKNAHKTPEVWARIKERLQE